MSTVKPTSFSGSRSRASPSAWVCGSPKACETNDARFGVVAWRPVSDSPRLGVLAHRCIDHDRKPGTGPGIKDRPRFADGGHHPHIGKAALGDLISHRKPHTVVAAKAIADPYNDTITHLRSMVGVRKCAEHEMHGS